jgi:hypothetical protein
MGDSFDDIIDLEPRIDPRTGETIFARADDPVVHEPGSRSSLVMTERGIVNEIRPAQPVALPDDRFAGDIEPSIDWREAERKQSGGLVVAMVDGKLVTGDDRSGGQPVELPDARFASPVDERFRTENQEVLALANAGAKSIVRLLKHSSRYDRWPASSPSGWVYTTKPTSHGDQLTTLIAFNASTGLYHVHFWRFDVHRGNGVLGAVDLPAYLQAHPNLTAHGTHMYPDGRGGAVLCLSTNVRGGLPTLSAAVFQAAKWADGMGDVVRGRRFPYGE